MKSSKALVDKSKDKLRDVHRKYVKKVRSAKEHHSADIIKKAEEFVSAIVCTCLSAISFLIACLPFFLRPQRTHYYY